MIDKNYVLTNLINKKGDLNVRRLSLIPKEELDQLQKAHPGRNLSESIFRLMNLEINDKCWCGAPLEFKTYREGFKSACCKQHVAKSPTTQLKRTATIKTKYGSLEEMGRSAAVKARETNINRYGCIHPNQLEHIRDKHKRQNINTPKHLELLSDPLWLYKQHIIMGKTMQGIAKELGCSDITVAAWADSVHRITRNIQQSRHSKIEYEFASNFKNKCIIGDRKAIGPLELDIFFPEEKVAVEICGLYWHSETAAKQIDRNKHQHKAELCAKKGIKLFTIFDIDLRDSNKMSIWISMINHALGNSTKIAARLCTVVDVQPFEARTFMDNNHIQGFASGHTYFGLACNNQLQAVIIIGKSRFKHNCDELIRFAVRKNTAVVGGLSKLMKHVNPAHLISYCDLTHGDGHGYSCCNFKLVQTTTPSYFYYKNNTIVSRYQSQKKKLRKLIPDFFSEDLTEFEMMSNAGYRRVWSCGSRVYEYKNNR